MQQKYIKDKLWDLDIKNLYTEFGFKSQDNAKTKFKEAVLYNG